MSYSAPSGLATKIGTGLWAPCFLWAIIPTDPTIGPFLFCDHDVPLTVILNNLTAAEDTALDSVSHVYRPTALTSFNDLEAKQGMELTNHDVEGATLLVSSSGISRDVILGGKLDNATMIVGVCDRNAPADGGMIRFKGTVDTVDMVNGAAWKIQTTSILKKLDMEPMRVIAPECDLEFGEQGVGKCAVKGVKTDPPTWVATTAYVGANGTFDRRIEDLVKPTTPNGFYYWPAGTGGTSGGSEPTWPTTEGDQVVDGSVTWTATAATRRTGAVTVITTPLSRSFQVDLNTIDQLFDHGMLTFTSGRNIGKSYPVLNYDAGSPSSVTLGFQPLLPVVVADTFLIIAGCSKTFDAQGGIDGQAYLDFYPDVGAGYLALDDADWAYIERLGYRHTVDGYAQFHFDFNGRQEGRTMFFPIVNQGCAKYRNQRRTHAFPFVPGSKIRSQRGTKQTET